MRKTAEENANMKYLYLVPSEESEWQKMPSADVFDHIERWYNPIRRHSTLGSAQPMRRP
jgi:transposase InsO family protein